MPEYALAEVQEAVSAKVGDRPAFRWRGATRTHREFTTRTRQLATFLLDNLEYQIPEPPTHRWESNQARVAILMLNRPEWLEAMFGCLKARMLPFNVNFRYVGRELVQLMALAKPQAIVYESRYADRVDSLRGELPSDILLLQVADDSDNRPLDGAHDYETSLKSVGRQAVRRSWSPDDGYLLFTGGTTGLPKGVLWRQGDAYVAVFNGRDRRTGGDFESLEQIVTSVSPTSRPVLPANPFMHGGGQWAGVTALLSGDTVVLPDVVDHLDAADIWRTVEREEVQQLAIAGNAFAGPLLDELDNNSYDLSCLRVVVSGAVAFGSKLKARLLAKLPHVLIIDNAGSSETGPQMALRSGHGSDVASGVFDPGPGTTVVNDDLSTTLAAGSDEIGWLARSGRVPLAYLFDEESTVTTFPVIRGTRWVVTGDRAKIFSDGRIDFMGRSAMTINSGGEKVFAEEVENAIASHQAVEDVLVIGRPSERWGSEVTALVQWKPGKSTTLDELRTYAGLGLATYKLPRRLVTVDKIQRSDAGKPDYQWARARCTGE